jgi:hypothetical protein
MVNEWTGEGEAGREEGWTNVDAIAAAAVDVACLVTLDAVGDAVAIQRDKLLSLSLGGNRRRQELTRRRQRLGDFEA